MISYISNRLFLIKDGEEVDGNDKIKHEDSDSSSDNGIDGMKKRVTLKRIPIGFFANVKLSFQRLGNEAGCSACCKKF